MHAFPGDSTSTHAVKGWKQSTRVHLLVIVLVTAAAYANSVGVPLVFDDYSNIVDNRIIRSFDFLTDQSIIDSTIGRYGYALIPVFVKSRMLGYATFALNYRLGGLDAAGYHVFNIIVHALAGCLLYMLARLILKRDSASGRFSQSPGATALLAALVFVAHPVQTEAVTYVFQRLASMAGMFYILSILMYVRFRTAASPRMPYVYYALCLLSMLAAMKTKENAFTAPVAAAMVEFMFFNGRVGRRLLCLVPLALTMLVIPLHFMGHSGFRTEMFSSEGKLSGFTFETTRWDYLLTQFTVLVDYIRLMFLPHGQVVDYPHKVYRDLLDAQVLSSLAALLALAGGGIYLLKRSYSGRPEYRVYAFGIFWFFITLSVESSLVPLNDLKVEHRLYLPSAGVFIAASAFAVNSTSAAANAALKRLAFPLAATLIAVLAALTIARNHVWRSEISLWADVVEKYPGNLRARNNLGFSLLMRDRLDEALAHLEIAAEGGKSTNSRVYFNLGNLYMKRGRCEKAIAWYTRGNEVAPRASDILANMARCQEMLGRPGLAIKPYADAIGLKPDNVPAYTGLASALMSLGKAEEAERVLLAGLKYAPQDAGLVVALAQIYSRAGRHSEAAAHYARALELRPGDPALQSAMSMEQKLSAGSGK